MSRVRTSSHRSWSHRGRRAGVVVLALVAHGSVGAGDPVVPQPPVGEPIPGLTPEELGDFFIGQGEFGTAFTTEDGLGPVFNEVSCGACHTTPLGGPGLNTVTRFGRWELGIYDPLEHLGGPLLQEFALDGACVEQVPPEANVVVVRATPGALGFGLIEEIADADLLALETTPPLPGISGRAHMMPAIEDEGKGPMRVGRFGWKSQLPTLLSFSEDASLFEMGLTDRFPGFGADLDPNGNTSVACNDTELDPELPQDLVTLLYFTDRVALFQRYLAPPPQTPRTGMTGEMIFDQIGCTACHVSQFMTAGTAVETALQNQVVRPYSDFLLHDMGAAADGMPQGDAQANEMRTSPLWGIRTRETLWHDGSIDNPVFEQRVLASIEMHGMAGGEPHTAGIVGDDVSPGAWDLLSDADQAAVVQFLGSLGRREFDADGDHDVDLADFLGFAACFTGPGSFYTPDDPCAVSDIDQDGDVDNDDFASFLLAFGGVIADCNANAVDDFTDIITGASLDADGNGVPDDCEQCQSDLDGDSDVDFADNLQVLGAWGACPGCPEDINEDGTVSFADLLILLGEWGQCPATSPGACCIDGTCIIDAHGPCLAAGGTYFGDDSICATVSCGAATGACCAPDGSCSTATAPDCIAVNGRYQGDDIACAVAGCTPATGACCFADGTCTTDTAGGCAGAGGTYGGDGMTCASADCAIPTGACCYVDGSCLEQPSDVCINAGGIFQGAGVTCVAADCQPIFGACCIPDGSCTVLILPDCTAAGGNYLGDDTLCADCPEPTGACCLPLGGCADLTLGNCDGNNGAYQGNGNFCAAVVCTVPMGACCETDGSCNEGTLAMCFFSGGTFEGDGTSCATASCAPTGACCFADGSCLVDTAFNCTGASGVYQGDDVDCVAANCPQPGACCLDDGSCTFGFASECTATGGVYQGDGVDCVAANCPQPGACCFNDGSCTFGLETACDGAGGTYQGDGVDCVSAACPELGACCLFVGSCTFGLEADCMGAGATYQGAGVTCAEANCPVPGACCLPGGNCNFLFESDCDNAGGLFQGEGVTCGSITCPETGACCLVDTTCTDGLETECAASGGTFRGPDTTCAGVTCVANDSCAAPELVDCNATIVVNTANASPVQNDGGAGDPELPAGSPSCQWNGVPTDTHNTLWYTFVADDTSVQLRTCMSTAATDTVVALYDGSCGSLTELACADDNCGDGGGSQFRSELCYDGLVPGNSYLIMVGNPGSWTGSNPGSAVLQVVCPCPTVGPVVGACCLPDDSCTAVVPADCTSAGGAFQGSGTACGALACVGACCMGDGSCTEVSATACAGSGGTHQGNGIDCATANCTPSGACCFSDGSCSVVTDVDCTAAGGTYQGDGVDCPTANCQPLAVLIVVPDAGAPGTQELAKQAAIENFGFTTTLLSAADSQASYDAAVAAADVVYIANEVTAADVDTKLVDAVIGVVNEERLLFDEFQIAATVGGATDTSVTVINDTHPVTESFTNGPLSICSSTQNLNTITGTLASGAQVLAEIGADPSLVVVEQGAPLLTGTAAGRRVALCWGPTAFDINSLTIDGLTILRRSLEWGAE